MQSHSNSRVGLAGVMLVALLLVTVAATASSGRDFSGYFDSETKGLLLDSRRLCICELTGPG